MTTPKISPPQARLYDAIKRGARLTYRGWQELGVDFGPRHPENYIAREATLMALRDRGLVIADRDGVRLP